MERLTKTYSDGTHGANDNLPCGENSYTYKGLLLEALGKYEDAEEQGLLLRLPCKVGDTIYRVNAGVKEPIIKMRVLAVNYKQFYKDITVIRKDRTVIRIYAINDIDMGESCYLLEDFGKTVFLTQAEAEAKLKELRCNHD